MACERPLSRVEYELKLSNGGDDHLSADKAIMVRAATAFFGTSVALFLAMVIYVIPTFARTKVLHYVHLLTAGGILFSILSYLSILLASEEELSFSCA